MTQISNNNFEGAEDFSPNEKLDFPLIIDELKALSLDTSSEEHQALAAILATKYQEYKLSNDFNQDRPNKQMMRRIRQGLKTSKFSPEFLETCSYFCLSLLQLQINKDQILLKKLQRESEAQLATVEGYKRLCQMAFPSIGRNIYTFEILYKPSRDDGKVAKYQRVSNEMMQAPHLFIAEITKAWVPKEAANDQLVYLASQTRINPVAERLKACEAGYVIKDEKQAMDIVFNIPRRCMHNDEDIANKVWG